MREWRSRRAVSRGARELGGGSTLIRCSLPRRLWATLNSLNCTKQKCRKGTGMYTFVTCSVKIKIRAVCGVRGLACCSLSRSRYQFSVQCAPCVVCNDLPECLEMILNVFLCEVLRDPTHEDLVYSFISVRVLEVLVFYVVVTSSSRRRHAVVTSPFAPGFPGS